MATPAVQGNAPDEATLATAKRYAESLEQFARATDRSRPRPAALHAFYRLNAAFYLDGYLPAAEHQAAMATAVEALAIATARRFTTPGRLPRPPALLRAGSGEDGRRRRLLAALASRAGDAHAVLTVQHVLEALPRLTAPGRMRLLGVANRFLAASAPSSRLQAQLVVRVQSRGAIVHLRPSPDMGESLVLPTSEQLQLVAAEREGLHCWAVGNLRPPRPGETLAWAHCITRRDPLAVLGQGLASGLAVTTLLDALTLAAALQAIVLPDDRSLHALIAAHAVRRLTDLEGRPALAAWLGVASTISGRVAVPKRPASLPVPDPRTLALTAVRSNDAHAAQLAEAGLMEAEALPEELREWVLQVVGMYLTRRCRAGATGG